MIWIEHHSCQIVQTDVFYYGKCIHFDKMTKWEETQNNYFMPFLRHLLKMTSSLAILLLININHFIAYASC